eukprot:UN28096
MDILINTPGRLLDLFRTSPTFKTRLKHCTHVIIDEADHMLTMGLNNLLKQVLAGTSSNRQTILLSATAHPDILDLAQVSMRPNYYFVDTLDPENTPNLTPSDKPNIQQYAIPVEEDYVLSMLHSILTQAVEDITEPRILVFFQTARLCQLAKAMFDEVEFPCIELHAKRTAKQRKVAFAQSRDHTYSVM